jgi:hypothetical protein
MLRFQTRLQHKQAFLFRLVDVANELFAMAASVSRAEALRRMDAPEAREAADLAGAFCALSRRRVKLLFRELWRNDDAVRHRTAVDVLAGRHCWLEEGAQRLMDDGRAAGWERPPKETRHEGAMQGL